MREKKRLESALTTHEELVRRSGDINAYFDLAREGEDVSAELRREVDELRSNSPLVGTPAEIVEHLGPFAEIGLQRVYLQLLDLSDLDHLRLFADEVQRQL